MSNFQNGQAFIGGFAAFAQTFVYAFFSFGGIELVAVAAGESAKPYKAVPRAIKATFFRIILFYILTILTIGLCINYADDTLLTAAYGQCTSLFFMYMGYVAYQTYIFVLRLQIATSLRLLSPSCSCARALALRRMSSMRFS